MGDIVINVVKDFSRSPGARYPSEGNFSGQEFREQLLSPKLKEAIDADVKLRVILDGSAGYATSFIEEAFGGLVRENAYSLDQILDTVVIISNEAPSNIDAAQLYMKNAWENRNL